MKVLYHVGATIGADTIIKKGLICEDARPLMIEAEDTNIVFDAIKSIEFVKLNGLGTMIKLQNNSDIIYLAVPRIFIDKGTGFAIINFFATRKLKYLLDSNIG